MQEAVLQKHLPIRGLESELLPARSVTLWHQHVVAVVRISARNASPRAQDTIPNAKRADYLAIRHPGDWIVGKLTVGGAAHRDCKSFCSRGAVGEGRIVIE